MAFKYKILSKSVHIFPSMHTYMIKGTAILHSYFVICVTGPDESIFL